jgi:integrase
MTGTLLTVGEAADYLKVSKSWVRRHLAELPVVRLGRSIRIDSSLLQIQLQDKLLRGKPLKSERASMPMPHRFQRGWIKLFRRKQAVWYGGYREDKLIEGKMERVRRKVRLGTLTELPTKAAAFKKLSGLMEVPSQTMMTFSQLAERWQKAEGPTMKASTMDHYKNALRYVRSFNDRVISGINREDIQSFLAEQARRYSRSVLRSIRVVLSLTLGWAKNCGWIERNPCEGIRLPREAGGRKVHRTVLTSQEVDAIVNALAEPYATLVLFLARTGLRIGEAIAIKWSDFEGNVLHVQRRLYQGKADSLKTSSSERRLPLSESLVERVNALRSRFPNSEWMFCSETGTTPVNPGNALKRYIRPAVKGLGISLGGWHDLRRAVIGTSASIFGFGRLAECAVMYNFPLV